MDDVSRKRARLERCPPGSNGRDVALFDLSVALRNGLTKGGKSGDLDEAITILREVLELRPPGHHARPFTLQELALCLLTRYDSRGAVSDVEEAVTFARAALELRPPGHRDRDVSLFDLACNLWRRFQRHARINDLEEALELHRAALELRPSGHPERSSSLQEVSLCLLNRYDSQGAVADLEEAVTLGHAALELRPPGHPGRAVCLYDLACKLCRRFHIHARMSDLEEAIELHRATLELPPSGHPERSTSLQELALCHLIKYDSQGAVADLEEAVTLGRAVLDLRLPGNPGRAVCLYDLAFKLWRRFQKLARMSDLEEAVELHRAALELRPPGHPDRSSSLHQLALCLLNRYDSRGAVADLEEAVALGRAALEIRLPGHPGRAVSLYELACKLWRRFRIHARMCDLEEAIEMHRAALELRPSGHPDRSSSLHELALCLADRYDSQGTIADLEEAVALAYAAFELCPPGHPGHAFSVNRLAVYVRKGFQKRTLLHDLEDPVGLRRAALELLPSGHPDRYISLHGLAFCLSDRYDSQGAVADLEEALSLGRAALEHCLPGHPDRAVSLNNLACDLRKRFLRYARRYDLEEAIELHRAALGLRPSGHRDRSSSLHQLALCLSDRYDSQGAVADLEEAVTLGRAALELRLPGHPDRAVSLYDLACDLRTRFQKHARMYDLEEAIELQRAALELRPSGHPDRSSSLHVLSLCLSDRYDSQGEVADLEEVVTLGRAALELYPIGHPSRASSLHDLAQRLAKHFRHQPIAADLNEAIALEQEALQLLTPGNPSYDVSRRCFMTYLQMKINPEAAITPPKAPDVPHFDVNQAIRGFAFDTLKMMPTRLLHTLTGALCNRDAQMSHFMSSQQYSQLLSSCRTCPPDQRTKLIHTTISGYFQFVTFSHRWGAGEPLLRDVEDHSIYGMSTEGGFGKLQAFCLRACEQNYLWAWSDTCCIDKDSSAELQEAIGSMFTWYRRSALTIVYLSDIPDTRSFRTSEWFRRGWTLQELLAPQTILFYTQNWSLYKNHTGSNHKANVDVIEELEKATGIEPRFLTEFSPGMDDARSRLQWASSRRTTRPEDIAYSLFGIFALHLPVLYGESAENALGRLLAEIISQCGDISVLDWVGEASPFHSCFPAHITSYQTLSSPLSSHTDAQPFRMSWRFLSSTALRKLHRSLTELPVPQFITVYFRHRSARKNSENTTRVHRLLKDKVFIIAMQQGKNVAPEIQWAIVRMSGRLHNDKIAMFLDLSTRTVRRIISHFHIHGTIPNPEEGEAENERKSSRHLRDVDVEFLLGAIQKSPDLYLDELQESLAVFCGVQVSRSTVWRTLRRHGFTMKKITRVAVERSAQKRLEYIARIGIYEPEQLVFVDESSVDRRTTYRGRAWSIRGTRAQRKAFFARGRRYSVLPALSLIDGILHCDIIEGSFCTETFTHFIEGLLDNMQPYPAPNSVIVMDNCKIHKHPEIQNLIQARGMRCEFLPPYSLDLNPIELTFSAMKYHLRRDGDYARMAMTKLSDEEVYTTLLKALCDITPEDARGWYSHCGYI